ncbi:hypothetical protein R1sor_001397 [Riccia sorocarpa]|uniref:DNA (cytosine-5-)-methyltransferase n=1 Tax=Riccia sorocarpa TaxID=122646 RepID=A0ABD3GYZ4_9MARC
MEPLFKQLQELRRHAEALVKIEVCSELKEEPLGPGDHSIENLQKGSCSHCGAVPWLETARRNAGRWEDRPLVVLSLFDGIGGVWASLCNLGIPFIGYSCEIYPQAIEVTKRRYGSVSHLGDVRKLKRTDIKETVVDLVVGGFPCQDLSCLGRRDGLHGTRSRLFFEMLRVMQVFSPTWFLAENVTSMSWVDRDEITRHLGITPLEIDSVCLTPCRRQRIYWSNIPYPRTCPRVKESEGTSIQSVLDPKVEVALATKNTCVLTKNITEIGRHSMEQVFNLQENKIRYLDVTEVELMMGYPPQYTNLDFEGYAAKSRTRLKTRCRLLGNTFSVPVISYLLSPLLNRIIRERTRCYYLPKSIRQQDCAIMASGEIWAMYNCEQRPNWYAKIVSRSGGRFDVSECHWEPGMKRGLRRPLHIEVIFLQLTKPYELGEPDLWNTIRGTGLFVLTDKVDAQSTWVAFSHRVTTVVEHDHNCYFIYPGKAEVWSIYDCGTEARYLVYVAESTVDKEKAVKGAPGKEGFSARCRLLQRKTQPDLYTLLDKEVVYDDLGVFSFRAPYHFLNERDTLKIELATKDRERGAKGDGPSRKRSRESDTSDYEELLDTELEDTGGDSDI